MLAKVWILICGLAFAGPALAVSPYLVKDINPISATDDSDPGSFVSLGSRALFIAQGGLWASDGSEVGTVRLANGTFLNFVAVGPRLAYALERTDGPKELWVTDGTPGGTFRVTDPSDPLIFRGENFRGFLAPGSDRLFFAANDLQHGEELWTSDGTIAGTRMIADLAPGAESSNPYGFTLFRNRIFFAATDARGVSLWSVDVAGASPKLVKDPDPRQRQTEGPSLLEVSGQTLYFFWQTAAGTSLWRSDGTERGTAQFAQVPATLDRQSVFDATVQLGRLFFVLDEGAVGGRELWVSNGTAAGTRRLTDFADPALGPARVLPLQLPGKPLLFVAVDAARGNEYWISNGTAAGTRLLKDICPGTCSGARSFPFLAFRGRLYFQGMTSATGGELWSTDVTASGTRLVKDVCAGPCESSAVPFATAGGKLYFGAIDGGHGDQVWRTDGTTAGTWRLTGFPPIGSFERFSGAAAGPALLFRGYDLAHGLELWSSRGTPQATRFLAELGTTSPGSSSPQSLFSAGTRVVFTASDGVRGPEVWGSDGTAAGTVKIRPDAPPGLFIDWRNAVSAENIVYFTQAENAGPAVLWRSDGTAAGTFPVTPPGVAMQIGGERLVVARGDIGYFTATDDAHGAELWTTDGTAAGTRLVADLEPGPDGSRPNGLKPFLGGLKFQASPILTRSGLYATDGTASGTQEFFEAFPFLEGYGPLDIETAGKALLLNVLESGRSEIWSTDGTESGTRLVLGNLLYLDAISAAGGRFLFRGGPSVEDDGTYLSDGTSGGTVRIASNLSLQPSAIGLRAAGGRFVFSALGLEPGDQLTLWSTDGTPGGTVPLIETESPFEQPRYAAEFLGELLLAGGSRIWITDGTSAGTSVLLDLGPPFPDASLPVVAGERAYFPWFTPELGTELWAYRPD